MTPAALIARAIQRERHRVGLSLSALAQQAGLAKSTLSQLESGQGNPSIETLWAIANVLGVPFSHLFEMPANEIKLIRAQDGQGVASEMADYQTQLLDKSPPGRIRDLYRVQLRQGSTRKAEAHPNGTVEHVFVISGEVKTGPTDQTEILKPGDYYRFPADVPHAYEPLTATAVLAVVMESPA
ncbi:XRE family transcriptional regulator [Cognatishimia sp. WU-CL00825]|uniref:helix-turn-helix domain-containing protein n=1 Tax=Cognatishimia sp. WU-CL00825 TaxID=3127658 RepID=UPI003102B6DC